MAPASHATTLLLNLKGGGPDTIAALFPLIYEELARIAHAQLRRDRRGHTLDTSALVHEAYLKLIDQSHVAWRDRAHFFALAARGMRQILIDYARKHNAAKRGGGAHDLPLDDLELAAAARPARLLALDEALDHLTQRDARMGRVVECRFFAGMNVEETAEALDLSRRTVERLWTKAKAYLTVMLAEDG